MKGLSVRRLLFQIHLWSGLILALPLALLGLTGSMLVYHDEIDGLFAADRTVLTAGGPVRSPVDIVAAARASLPDSAIAVSFAMPREPGQPATLRVAPRARAGQRGAAQTIAIDPVTLAVLDAPARGRGGFDLMRMIHNLHGNFLVTGRLGRDLVGYAGIVMLGLGLSGIVLWWPRPGRWKQAFSVTWKARGFRFNRELHGAVGIWGLAIFCVVSFSGIYLAFPQTLTAALGTVLPARDVRGQVPAVTVVAGATRIDLAAALDTAAAALGEPVTLRMAAFPVTETQSYRLVVARAGAPDEDPVTAFVDPWTARLIDLRDPRAFTAGETLLALQRPLHDGSGLGWLYRALVFVSGLLPALFVVTGLVMWLKRGTVPKPRARPRRAAPPGHPRRSASEERGS